MRQTETQHTNTDNQPVLTARTYVQVGTLVSVLLFAVSATWWFAKFDARLTSIETSLNGRWSAHDMQIFTLQLRNLNANLVVPDIKAIIALRPDRTSNPNE